MTKYTAEWCAANPEEAAMVISNLQAELHELDNIDACNTAAQEALELDRLADEEIPVAPSIKDYSDKWGM